MSFTAATTLPLLKELYRPKTRGETFATVKTMFSRLLSKTGFPE